MKLYGGYITAQKKVGWFKVSQSIMPVMFASEDARSRSEWIHSAFDAFFPVRDGWKNHDYSVQEYPEDALNYIIQDRVAELYDRLVGNNDRRIDTETDEGNEIGGS